MVVCQTTTTIRREDQVVKVSSLAIRDIKSTLRRYGIVPTKKRGQSFLTDISIAQRMVDLAAINSKDRVLEIGGGLGILTSAIAERAGEVTVIEIDPRLVRTLHDRFSNRPNVIIIEGDALHIEFPHVNKVVSNLPYSISSEITFRILREIDFELAVLMYQEEFAERLMAQPGSEEYSRLSIGVRYLAEIERVMRVPAAAFYPVPSVNSMVVRVRRRREGIFARDSEVFYSTIQGIYSYPNKLLRKALRIWFKNRQIDEQMVDKVLTHCERQVSGDERLRDLTLEQLVSLSDAILDVIGTEIC